MEIKLCKDCKWFCPAHPILWMFSTNKYLYGTCTKYLKDSPASTDSLSYILGGEKEKEFYHASTARQYDCGVTEARGWEPKEK